MPDYTVYTNQATFTSLPDAQISDDIYAPPSWTASEQSFNVAQVATSDMTAIYAEAPAKISVSNTTPGAIAKALWNATNQAIGAAEVTGYTTAVGSSKPSGKAWSTSSNRLYAHCLKAGAVACCNVEASAPYVEISFYVEVSG